MAHLRLFGAVELRDSGGRDLRRTLGGPKRIAILAYLVSAGVGRPTRRDTLLAVFWPELDQERSRRALRQALFGIRRGLGADIVNGKDDEDIEIDHSKLWCDVSDFEREDAVEHFANALDLYRGQFLDGFHLNGDVEFSRWVDDRRQHYQARAMEMAWTLAQSAEADANLGSMVHWARTAFSMDPADETSLRRFITLLDKAGDRSGALREFERFAARLQAEYGAAPSPETQTAIDIIRHRCTPHPNNSIGRTPSDTGAQGPFPPPSEPVELAPTPQGGAASSRTRWMVFSGLLVAMTLAWWLTIGLPNAGGQPIRILITVPAIEGDYSYPDLAAVAADWLVSGVADVGKNPVVAIQAVVERYAPVLNGAGDPLFDLELIKTHGRLARSDIVIGTRIRFSKDSVGFDGELHDLRDGSIRPIPSSRIPAASIMNGLKGYRNGILTALGQRADPDYTLAARSMQALPAYASLHMLVLGKLNFTSDSAPAYFGRATALDSTFRTPRVWTAVRLWAGNQLAELDSFLLTVPGWPGNETRADRIMLAWIRHSALDELVEAIPP